MLAGMTKNVPAKTGRGHGRTERPVSEARKRVFLKVLAETGIVRAASRAASPEADPKHGAAATFHQLRKRDAEFAAQWNQALAEADERLEEAAYARAVEGINEPVFQRGQQAKDADGKPAFITRYSDRLLERLLEARMPHRWAQHRKVEYSGSVGHGNAVAALSLSDVEYLNVEQRQALANILRTIQDGRRRSGDDAEVVDAEWSEVEEAEGADQGEPEALSARGLSDDRLRAMRDMDPSEAAELASILG